MKLYLLKMTNPAVIGISAFFIFILTLAIIYAIVFLTLYGAFAVFITASNQKLPPEIDEKIKKEIIKKEIKLIVTPVAYVSLFVTGIYAFWIILFGGITFYNTYTEETKKYGSSVGLAARSSIPDEDVPIYSKGI